MNGNTILRFIKNLFSWIFAAFVLLIALGCGFGIGSILLVITAILSLPIRPIRNLWNRLPGMASAGSGKGRHLFLKPLLLSGVFLVSFIVAAATMEPVPTQPMEEPILEASLGDTAAPETEPEKETEAESTESVADMPETADEKDTEHTEETQPEEEITDPIPILSPVSAKDWDPSSVPAYSGSPYCTVNKNVPFFSRSDYTTASFEYYSDPDSLGRCGTAYASVGIDLMPTEERGAIGQIRPSGWHTVKYDCVDGKYLYNRCHLIGYQLSGENANEKNLITGTRYLNVDGMLPFENMIADYVKETRNHVLYRVTPVFEGRNLLASGVLLEALSMEDQGDGICFNVYCYNVQPGVMIDYADGSSALANGAGSSANESGASSSESVSPPKAAEETSSPAVAPPAAASVPEPASEGVDYVLNTNTHKFHYPSCSSVKQMAEKNKQFFTGSREEVIGMGYEPCQRCNP